MQLSQEYTKTKNNLLNLYAELNLVNEKLKEAISQETTSSNNLLDCVKSIEVETDLILHKTQILERIVITENKLKKFDDLIEFSDVLENCLALEVQ
jgi:hypothetical protein